MDGKSWTGGAMWTVENLRSAKRLTWPFVELHLNSEGGALISTVGSKHPSIHFEWADVQLVEKVYVPSLFPSSVRIKVFRSQEDFASVHFLFSPGGRWRVNEILDFAEEQGAKVERKFRVVLTV